MDRAAAERLMAAISALDAPLGEIDAVISQNPEEAERQAFICSLGDIFRSLNEGFVMPIAREHPDLDPDG